MINRPDLTEESRMPFGMFRKILMKNIPPEYFIRLYDHGAHGKVKKYIEERLTQFKEEVERKKNENT